MDGVPFDVRCLTDNVALNTARANDAADREGVFVNQVRGVLRDDDLVPAISIHGGSGFAPDLVRLVRCANNVGAHALSLVGCDGGLLHQESSCSILVPADSFPQTEGVHVVIAHWLM